MWLQRLWCDISQANVFVTSGAGVVCHTPQLVWHVQSLANSGHLYSSGNYSCHINLELAEFKAVVWRAEMRRGGGGGGEVEQEKLIGWGEGWEGKETQCDSEQKSWEDWEVCSCLALRLNAEYFGTISCDRQLCIVLIWKLYKHWMCVH